jgi:hypothetical protein
VHATNDEADGESAGECAEQRRCLIGKGHRQHQSDIQRAKYHTGDQTKDNIRHADGSSALALGLQHLVRIRTVDAILGKTRSQNSVKNYMSHKIGAADSGIITINQPAGLVRENII